MNLSVLVVESSIASTNQIAKGMLLALIKFVKFTPTNQIRYSLRADQRKTGVTLLLGIFGERFTGGTGTSFSVPQPSSCVLHSVLLPSLIDRFRTLPSVSRCCQPISDASACVRILDCKRGECGAPRTFEKREVLGSISTRLLSNVVECRIFRRYLKIMIPLTIVSMRRRFYYMKYKFQKAGRLWKGIILASFGVLLWIWGECIKNILGD